MFPSHFSRSIPCRTCPNWGTITDTEGTQRNGNNPASGVSASLVCSADGLDGDVVGLPGHFSTVMRITVFQKSSLGMIVVPALSCQQTTRKASKRILCLTIRAGQTPCHVPRVKGEFSSTWFLFILMMMNESGCGIWTEVTPLNLAAYTSDR